MSVNAKLNLTESLDDEIDLRSLVFALYAGKFKILIIIIMSVSIGAFSVANTERIYQAEASIQLEERGGLGLPEEFTLFSDDKPTVATEIAIIRSRLVASRAVADVKLSQSLTPLRAPVIGTMLAQHKLEFLQHKFLTPYQRWGEFVELEFLIMPDEWRGLDIKLTSRGPGKFLLLSPEGRKYEGESGVLLNDPGLGLSLIISDWNAPVGREFTLKEVNDIDATKKVLSNLSVSELTRSSSILRLSYKATTARRAEEILAAVSTAYTEQNIARSAAVTEQGLAFVKAQIPIAREKLDKANENLNFFRASAGSVDLTAEAQNILLQVSALEEDLLGIEAEGEVLIQSYTTQHPSYKQFELRKSQVEGQLELLRTEVTALPEIQQEAVNLARELELNSAIYTQLLTRAQEIEVARAGAVGSVRVIDHALASNIPVAPRSARILALSALLGLILGVSYVLIIRMFKSGIVNAMEIEALGIPVYATVPQALGQSVGRRRQLAVVSLTNPESLAVEAFRSLRTSLHFGLLEERRNSLLFTSAAPNAGKSFSAVNLAVVSAQAGQRVVLVDGDMRRGTVHKYFGIQKSAPGLSAYLSGNVGFEEIKTDVDVPNLTVIHSGTFPPNPSELLLQERAKMLIDKLEQEYDLVIVDGPPVLAVTDPVILSRYVSMRLLVARFGSTKVPELEATIQQLAVAGIKVAGAVLNGFDPKQGGYGYGYGGYEYGYRYSYIKKTDE
jgi:tyrosine-protein kinase Etk/Wzc